jgi:hypothetical protein
MDIYYYVYILRILVHGKSVFNQDNHSQYFIFVTRRALIFGSHRLGKLPFAWNPAAYDGNIVGIQWDNSGIIVEE